MSQVIATICTRLRLPTWLGSAGCLPIKCVYQEYRHRRNSLVLHVGHRFVASSGPVNNERDHAALSVLAFSLVLKYEERLIPKTLAARWSPVASVTSLRYTVSRVTLSRRSVECRHSLMLPIGMCRAAISLSNQ